MKPPLPVRRVPLRAPASTAASASTWVSWVHSQSAGVLRCGYPPRRRADPRGGPRRRPRGVAGRARGRVHDVRAAAERDRRHVVDTGQAVRVDQCTAVDGAAAGAWCTAARWPTRRPRSSGSWTGWSASGRRRRAPGPGAAAASPRPRPRASPTRPGPRRRPSFQQAASSIASRSSGSSSSGTRMPSPATPAAAPRAGRRAPSPRPRSPAKDGRGVSRPDGGSDPGRPGPPGRPGSRPGRAPPRRRSPAGSSASRSAATSSCCPNDAAPAGSTPSSTSSNGSGSGA